MSQTVDRVRLVRLWSAKAHWVAWTEEELKYITGEDGVYSTKKILELRKKYHTDNEEELLNPWRLEIEEETEQAGNEAINEEIEEEEISLEDLQAEYKELYGEDPANRYKSDIDRLIKKIGEKKE